MLKSEEESTISISDIHIENDKEEDPLEFLKYGFFINLKERRDRLKNVMTQLHFLNIPTLKVNRMSAIKHRVGALGCFISHIHCLIEAQKNGYDHVFICEDDIEFTNIPLFKKQLKKTLETVKDWDVLLLTANLMQYEKIPDTDCCIRVTKSTAATGYIVKSHYYDKLLKNFRDGVSYLKKNPKSIHLYAIDVFWHSLQKDDKWILPIPLTVTQKVGYSNIENKIVNYNKILLKPVYFIKKMI